MLEQCGRQDPATGRRRLGAGSRGSMLVLAFAVLLTASSCSMPGADCSQPPAVRVSQQSAQRLQARVEQIWASGARTFSLEATEEEATSYLELSLPQVPLADASIVLQEGRARLFGNLTQPLTVRIDATLSAKVDDGQVRVKVERASLACVALPSQILDSLSATVNQMIVESQASIQVTDIKITTGRLAVSGVRSR